MTRSRHWRHRVVAFVLLAWFANFVALPWAPSARAGAPDPFAEICSIANLLPADGAGAAPDAPASHDARGGGHCPLCSSQAWNAVLPAPSGGVVVFADAPARAVPVPAAPAVRGPAPRLRAEPRAPPVRA